MDYKIIELANAGAELASAPFQTHSRMTQIAMAEKPADFIADTVMPRVSTPFKFEYTKGISADQFTIPETRASRAGRLNEVEFGATLADGSTDDHGLIAYVPERDIREARAQQSAWDPLAQASSGLVQLLSLRREQRVSELVFSNSSYPAGYRKTLAGSSQWSDASSDPVKEILEALDRTVTRPNTLVLGQAVWTQLRMHPLVVEAVKQSGAGKANAAGVVMRQAVADLLELDRVLVGSTWHQSANRGQNAVYSRLWGKHAALLTVRRPSSTRDAMPSWGFTAQAMPISVMTSQEPSRGIGSGSRALKVSECIREIISWDTAGYFFQNAVA